jgi:hypothetical protein
MKTEVAIRTTRLVREAMRVRVQQSSSRAQNGKRAADASDWLVLSLAATLLIEVITRWFERLADPPREIALYSSRLSSSQFKEVMRKRRRWRETLTKYQYLSDFAGTVRNP